MALQGEHGISWTDATWNPIRGCSMARGSATGGCLNCYAARQAVRHSGPGRPYEGLARMTSSGPRWTGEVRLIPERLADPIHWTKPRRLFVNSMSDLFHESVATHTIAAIFGIMALAPRHQFQVLTKRAERMRAWFAELPRDGWDTILHCLNRLSEILGEQPAPIDVSTWPLPNVWLGISCEDQATAEARIPLLLETPAAVRWVSAEPLLGPIDLTELKQEERRVDALSGWQWPVDGLPPAPGRRISTHALDWVVVGGESGPDARPMHVRWAQFLRDQCQEAGVPFHFKQPGSVLAREWGLTGKGSDPNGWPDEFRVQEYPQ